MNIDLFLTKHGESGLICLGTSGNPVSGVILDAETNLLTLEFGESGHTLHLNIPVEDDHRDRLLFSPKLQIGVIEDGVLADHREVPLLYLNDPYGSDFGDIRHAGRPAQSFIRFEQFMKRCTFAQAVHRDDLSDENSAGSVLKGLNPHILPCAPQLLRRQAAENVQQLVQAQTVTYGARPPGAHGPKGMGGAGQWRPVRHATARRLPPDGGHE